MTEPTVVVGNLTRDPELRFTPSGVQIAKFSIASTPRAKNPETGRWEDAGPTIFTDCVAWRNTAELVGESLLKGDGVIVSGTLKSNGKSRPDGTPFPPELDCREVGILLRKYPIRIQRPERAKAGADAPDAWVTAEPLPPF